MAKTASISIRVPAYLKKYANSVAQRDRRSMGSYIESLILEKFQADPESGNINYEEEEDDGEDS